MSNSTPSTSNKEFDVAHLCRQFSELSPQPMLAVEGTTHIVRYLNAAFATLVGKKRAELIGRPFAQAVPEGESNGCLALLNRVYHTGTPETLEEQPHGSSSVAHWSYLMWAILGEGETPAGVMIQVTDATEAASFRQRAVGMNEQLLVSGIRQHKLTEDAEIANRVKDEFLATVSHELRTPLTVIVGWAEILSGRALDTQLRERGLKVILRNARAQSLLIDDLLDASRIVTGKLRLNMQPTDLETLIVAATEALRVTAEAKQIELQLQIESADFQVMADPDRLQQVAWNLLSNALKFTPQGGSVRVGLAQVEASVEITISDSGQGIAPEFLPHVFERFRQADSTSTRAFGGLGLGLAIVRQLVELHGGTVRVESEGEGLGASFTVTLPLLSSDSAEMQDDDGCAPHPTSLKLEATLQFQGLRVLVVDDEPDTRDMLQFVLESCGAQVETANSAAVALQLVAQAEFDVLISDIGMSEEDGCLLLAKVRALAQARGTKVPAAAALTAYVSEKDRIRVLQSGFQIHVPKPISPHELIAVVTNLAGPR